MTIKLAAGYGLDENEWQAAKGEIRQILVERAKSRGTIIYSDLASIVSSISLEPHSGELAALLREISTEEFRQDRGMLSAVVVHGKGNRIPGPGFFQLAECLGRDTTDKKGFLSNETRRVYEDWAGH